MLNELDILRKVPETLKFPPLTAIIDELNPIIPSNNGKKLADMILTMEWKNQRKKFVVEMKKHSAPSLLVTAIQQVREYSKARPDLLPLVIVPYLGPQSLERLIDAGVSGIDLCGNGVVNVPGTWFVYRTGGKNRFPSSLPIKNVYRGTSSIVARVFLSRSLYDSVNGIRDEIVKRGGNVNLSTVSKVLKALQEDLIIGRNGGIKLLQEDRLLDLLKTNYRKPLIKRIRGTIPDVQNMIMNVADVADQNKLLVASRTQTPYVILPRSTEMTSVYASSAAPIMEEFGFEETNRFPNVEFLETDDPTVYFDRRDNGPIPSISPLQAYLELSQGGKREQEAAEPLRNDVLTFRYDK